MPQIVKEVRLTGFGCQGRDLARALVRMRILKGMTTQMV